MSVLQSKCWQTPFMEEFTRVTEKHIPLSPQISVPLHKLSSGVIFIKDIKKLPRAGSIACSPRLLKGAKVFPSLLQLCAEMLLATAWLNCRSPLLLAWNKYIKYFCLNKKEPRAAVSFHFQAKGLAGWEQSQQCQETLPGDSKSLSAKSDGSPSSRIKWKIGNLAQHQAHTPRPGWWSQTHPLLPQSSSAWELFLQNSSERNS